MALCEVDANLVRQVEAFLQTKTPTERQTFTSYFDSLIRRELRALFARYPGRLINSGSFTTRTALGERTIERQEILDPQTQLSLGHANSLTLSCIDGRVLSLHIVQEEIGPDPTIKQVQTSNPYQTVTFNPSVDQS